MQFIIHVFAIAIAGRWVVGVCVCVCLWGGVGGGGGGGVNTCAVTPNNCLWIG